MLNQKINNATVRKKCWGKLGSLFFLYFEHRCNECLCLEWDSYYSK